ncbi:MarR family transcriptional regulator [Ammoniphilus sp. CFH 90114]|uniref:MarR family transcriptional regulator n=1 Tax=Ammoniphilus sp. CFH 90114 TaxID=2493665 RepID=UPI00100EC6AB|nr:MarR family transcriptional regulator [Ammoniphilus sp. CFH 90114]RXT13613.1 MarR family transcriptional regulator [Ammoniphilus sp. CFH 90114]
MVDKDSRLSSDLHMMINVVRAMYKTLEEDWTRQAKQHDLTSPQQHLLWILHFRDGSTITEVANLGLWHISTAMHLIDKLEEKNLVRKERLRNDKRASRVYLTEKGRALREKMSQEDDFSIYKLHSVIEKKREVLGVEYGQLLQFGLAVTQELYGKEYTDFLESSAKMVHAEVEQNEKEQINQ